MAMAARTTAVVSFAICLIFGADCSWRGAVANGGGSWGGCVDNGSSCGVASKLSNRFFGALAGARFFFGFRPRLLGIGKQLVRSADKVSASRQCRPTPPDGFPLICKIDEYFWLRRRAERCANVRDYRRREAPRGSGRDAFRSITKTRVLRTAGWRGGLAARGARAARGEVTDHRVLGLGNAHNQRALTEPRLQKADS